jgi:hypothetical protein
MIAMMFFCFIRLVGVLLLLDCWSGRGRQVRRSTGGRSRATGRGAEELRILRIILEHYSALQSTELLVAARSLIHQVK